MTRRFFGKQIEVATSGDVKSPDSFVLDGREYKIAAVLEMWFDTGYGRSAPSRKKWWMRRHRNYYRVLTTDSEEYEIYYDRGVNLANPQFKKWFVTRQF